MEERKSRDERAVYAHGQAGALITGEVCVGTLLQRLGGDPSGMLLVSSLIAHIIIT